tara:strand:- start:3515 stop:5500 length:1986 start_codon:yes stop_codon:yes gene_type:complete
MKANNKILVTSALPYANGPIHLGHLVEYIQTDIWVRFRKSIGDDVAYICADDAHGTPIMLKAQELKISPEDLISKMKEEHKKDFEKFFINFDHYSSTNSEKNRELCEEIFLKLQKNKHISQKVISQFYDDKEKIFLPDRYIKGECPKCGAQDQYGDSCENCGATYEPTELKNPLSVLSNTKPMTKDTNHYFFNLKDFRDYLSKWTKNNNLQPAIKNKLDEWLNDNLNNWDITRDSPYFGFKIPNEENKYFYVWMDAPIGYIAALQEFAENNDRYENIWSNEKDGEIYHFIGKDIAYFHALFWPSILKGAGYRTPNGIFCHGFLTVDGKKMSKSRGTFIKASDYLKYLDPEFLRYYFASRLNDSIEDIDLNFDELVKKINSDLIGKLINLASRCSAFLEKNSNLMLSEELDDKEKFTSFLNDIEEIKESYSQRKYSNAVNKIMNLTDTANQYINEKKPWALNDLDQVQKISTQGLNYYRTLVILLSPIMPNLLKQSEIMFNEENLTWNNSLKPLLNKKINKFKVLKNRIQKEDVQKLKDELVKTKRKQKESKMSKEIDYQDFSKVNLIVGEIVKADNVEGADKLLKLNVDLGDFGTKEIFSGIKKFYKSEDLVGKKTLVVENLEPKEMKFGTSSGMVLAADSDGDIIVLELSKNIKNGSKVK